MRYNIKIVIRQSLILVISVISLLEANLLSLIDAENMAITNGYEMRIKELEEQAIEWEKKATISGYLPTVNYSLTYLRLNKSAVDSANASTASIMGGLSSIMVNPMQIQSIIDSNNLTNTDQFPRVDPQTFSSNSPSFANNSSALFQNTFSHEFTLNQPISNGGVEIFAIKIARYTNKAIEYQLIATRQNSIYSARKAYFDLLSAIEREKVSQEDISWAKINLKKTEIKFEGESISENELIQWKYEVIEKESNLTQAIATRKFMYISLLHIIGEKNTTNNNRTLIEIEPFIKNIEKSAKILTGSVNTNPTLMAVEAFMNVAKQNKNIAISAFLPKLNAFASLSLNNKWQDSTVSSMYTPPISWSTGVALSVPIFSGFKNSRKVRQAKFENQKTFAEYEQIKSQLTINLERIKLFYIASHKSVLATKEQLKLMQRNLEIMQHRYDGGMINQSQLLEVALGFKQTKIGYIQKMFECFLLEAEYLMNIGKLEVTQ